MISPPGHVEEPELSSMLREALDAAGLGSCGYAFVVDLASQRCGAHRADENVYPASVIKVPIMAEAFRQYAAGTLDPLREVVVSAENQTTTAEPSPFVPGYTATVEELVSLMVTHSDNVATNQLFDVLRRENVTSFMRSLGLSTFLLGRKLSGSEPLIGDPETVGRNRLTPREIGTLLALIADDRVPGAAAQRAILARCVHGEKLARGLRPDDRFMHKTGETDEVSHDAGILETAEGKRTVVVLYTSPPPKPDRSDADHFNPHMVAWMRLVRQALEKCA